MKSRTKRNRRRTRQEIDNLLERYEKSGKTVRAFCEAEGVSESVLYRWLGRARKQTSSSTLVEVKPPMDLSARVTVATPSGYRVEIPAGFCAEDLKRLLGLLER